MIMNLEIITPVELGRLEEKVDALLESVINLSSNPAHIIFDNGELQEKLGVSERTLQTWRDEGIIGFSKIKNTIFYRLDDVLKMLNRYYVPAHD